MRCDFSGYVTKYDLLCSDGRTIAKDAFKECNNKTVPLTYGFDGDPTFVVGNVTLEHRSDGVYGYCVVNDTPSGRIFHRLVKDHEIHDFAIYANKLKEENKIVTYGVIRAVSLAFLGANPGAYIDYYV